jgi:hypothetical protein
MYLAGRPDALLSDQGQLFQFIRVEDIAYDRNDPHVVSSPIPANAGRSRTPRAAV